MTAEFVVNNKIYSVTKISLFIANCSGELRIEGDIRRKEKLEKTTEFVERVKKGLRESGSSIEKSIGENEEISR